MPEKTITDPLLDTDWLGDQFGNLPADEREWLVELVVLMRRKHLGKVEAAPEGWISSAFADAEQQVKLIHPAIRAAALRSGTADTVGARG